MHVRCFTKHNISFKAQNCRSAEFLGRCEMPVSLVSSLPASVQLPSCRQAECHLQEVITGRITVTLAVHDHR
jgi:hypothetical protein